MTPPIDDRYFEWLYGQFAAVTNRNPARSYWHLCRKLHSTEFVWLIPNDDNRVADAYDLRAEFVGGQDPDGIDPAWLDLGVSVLETLVALSRRAHFQTDDEPVVWFGIFLTNLTLKRYTDEVYNKQAERRIEQIIDRFIYRTYRPNGRGGLFPLKRAPDDQTKVELWYQMHSYIRENKMV